MAWLRLDDQMGDHRKVRRVLKASRPAIALHLLGLLHCARYLTDGVVEGDFVTETCDAARMRDRERLDAIAALEQHELWEPIEGGWRIHDYLDYNPSREQVEEQRRKDADRKAKGRTAQSNGRPRGVRSDSVRILRGLPSESDGPVPTRPDPVKTPLPPEGEMIFPTRPSGKRKRDLVVFEEDVRRFAGFTFPEHEPDAAYNLAVNAAAFAVDRGRDPQSLTPSVIRSLALDEAGAA